MRFDDAGISRTFYAIFKERCGNIREDPREGDGHLSFVGGEGERNGRGRASRATFCASRGVYGFERKKPWLRGKNLLRLGVKLRVGHK